MRGRRFDRVLATLALAFALTASTNLTALGDAGEEDLRAVAPALRQTAHLSATSTANDATAGEASALTEAEIESRVPVPESANVPPPSAADVGGPATGTAAATPAPDGKVSDGVATPAPEGKDGVPVPEPANVPPPSAQDVAAVQDPPIVAAMRDLMGAKLSRLVDRKNERSAIEAFYAKRGFAPLWIENDEASPRAKAAIGYLGTVDAEGLDPADYRTPVFRAGAEPAALAEAEIRLTSVLLTYARHAQGGRVHWTRISADVFYGHSPAEPADTLAQIADAKDISETLASFNPPHAGYKALKAKLAEARGRTGEREEIVRVPEGPMLRPGMEDARVPAVRKRLNVTSDPDSESYDAAVVDAVKAFQKSHGLSPDGMIGANTLRVLNGGPRRDRARDVDVILSNMERWRWLPRDLGNAHVVLNIPDYTLRVYRDGAVIWQTRVVVGSTKNPTPILTETMKYITVNPTWNVPPSIVYNEYLPALQQDPTVLQRMGLKLSQNRDGSVHISQPPGERNALGRIRFNFPNRFLVYQHDTPDKHLFAHEKRAYSHGCMRVQDPAKYAEVLLSIARPNDGYTQDRIKKMFGTSEIDIQLPTHIPVHITYQTAFVDDAGKLVIRDDVYSRDTRVIAALKGEERRFADTAVDRPKPSYARPAVNLPYGVSSGSSFASGGPSFFDMLFGNAGRPQEPVRPQRRTYAR
jgi:murein L,D-transpeptidase YcbB/YkuD